MELTSTPHTAPRDPQQAPPTRWGRSARLGGGSGRLVAVSILMGVAGASILAAGATALAQATSDGLSTTWALLFPLVFFVLAAPVLAMGAWALLVDRSSVRGATVRPEDSIENRWYDRAAQATFHVMLPVVGLGAAVASITRWRADAGLLLMGVAVLMVAVFAIAYAVARRADA
ncbi:hypothetical protein ACQB6R_02410 [Propionibacteriaceae bacterium G1746]|uniref:hypothetical protein n=1 Tax=Aestuariimicrobium sp. G57 TaxID=3418485 RepID=UPI003C1708C8